MHTHNIYHLFRVWQAWVNKFHLEIGVTEWILAQGSEPKGNQFLIFVLFLAVFPLA